MPVSCVFHCMRVLERGIFATELGMALTPSTKANDRTWGGILKPIKLKWTNNPELGRQAPRGDFFERVVADFETVKIAWRNQAMHVERPYSFDAAKADLRCHSPSYAEPCFAPW